MYKLFSFASDIYFLSCSGFELQGSELLLTCTGYCGWKQYFFGIGWEVGVGTSFIVEKDVNRAFQHKNTLP